MSVSFVVVNQHLVYLKLQACVEVDMIQIITCRKLIMADWVRFSFDDLVLNKVL